MFLDAVFGPADAFPEAWDAWDARTGQTDLGQTGTWLLPLAVPRLNARGIDGPRAAEARLSIRNVRARNVFLLRELTDILALLNAAGIETLLLKGASLLAGAYADLGLRPMNDLDIAVRPTQFADALTVLQDHDWQPVEQIDIVDTRFIHAVDLLNRRGTYLDLHCHPILQSCRAGLDEPLWQRAQPVAGAGWRSRRLCPEHQVLQLIAHGFRWPDRTAARWVPDVLMSVQGTQLNWPLLVETATALELTDTVGPALNWLNDRGYLRLPDEVRQALGAVKIARREARLRRVLSKSMRPGSIVDSAALHMAFLDHCRGDGSILALLPLVVPYIRSRPGLGGRSLLHVMSRYAARYGRGAPRRRSATAARP
jgi:hypothetical protein